MGHWETFCYPGIIILPICLPGRNKIPGRNGTGISTVMKAENCMAEGKSGIWNVMFRSGQKHYFIGPPVCPRIMINRLKNDAPHTRVLTGSCHTGKPRIKRVRLSESPLCMKVWWKRGHHNASYLIGTFLLDLNAMLLHQIVSSAPGHPGEVILQLQCTANGDIEISKGTTNARLKIGNFRV